MILTHVIPIIGGEPIRADFNQVITVQFVQLPVHSEPELVVEIDINHVDPLFLSQTALRAEEPALQPSTCGHPDEQPSRSGNIEPPTAVRRKH